MNELAQGGLQQGWKIYLDPWAERLSDPVAVNGYGQVDAAIRDLYMRLVESRIREGRDPWLVTVINREKPSIHRFFDINLDTRATGIPHYPGKPALPYPGAETLLESILFGIWRVASIAEEAACREKDANETAAAKLATKDRRRELLLNSVLKVN